MTAAQRSALRALALKATPGPWAWQDVGGWHLMAQHGMRPVVLGVSHRPNRRHLVVRDFGLDLLTPLTPDHADAAHIAACDPATVLELCDAADAHDALRSAAVAAREALERSLEYFEERESVDRSDTLERAAGNEEHFEAEAARTALAALDRALVGTT
jgi:Ead/Ea22-like protein